MDNIETYNNEDEGTLWMSQSRPPFSAWRFSISCTESKSGVSLIRGKWVGSGNIELDSELWIPNIKTYLPSCSDDLGSGLAPGVRRLPCHLLQTLRSGFSLLCSTRLYLFKVLWLLSPKTSTYRTTVAKKVKVKRWWAFVLSEWNKKR